MKSAVRVSVATALVATLGVLGGCGKGDPRLAQQAAPPPPACPTNDSGLTLSPGFCATIFADNLGHARHLVVSPEGVVYVNTWSGIYYGNDKPPEGGFLVALQDRDGDGKAEVIERFGATPADKVAGGTGIQLYDGALYAELDDRILKFPLSPDSIVPQGRGEVVVSNLPMSGDHMMHPFVIDAQGQLFVNSGSASNACERPARQPGAKGQDPCRELDTRGGIWRYDAKQTGQRFAASDRYAAGIRNAGGLAFDASGRLYATQHGRDQLPENWPKLYTPEAGREVPAEVLFIVEKDGDYGWPYCYFDGGLRRSVRAPEYGGDGKDPGDCWQKHQPAAHFPAHWAPLDVLIYTGTQFPEPWRNGAFIAFHGSWNRAPGPQGGYNVVFQPLAEDGKAGDPYVIFADGFAGAEKAPGRAEHRPSGLAMGPDGALYIADDVKGRIWRVTHLGGNAPTAVAPAPEPPVVESTTAIALSSLTPPDGVSAEVLAQGERVFRGQAAGGTCTGCHGSDGRGTQVGNDLTNGNWLHSDGSLAGIKRTIQRGVTAAKQGIGAMPPLGAAPLSEADVDAVAAYVYALGHRQGAGSAAP